MGCGKWSCANCGPKKCAAFRERASRIPKSYRTLKFLTITAPREPCCGDSYCRGDCGQCVKAFNRAWRKLYQWLRRREPNSYHYMWSNERGEQSNHLHKHAILNIDYVPQAELSAACERFGLGRITDIRAVKSAKVAAAYLSKYLAKGTKATWPRGVRRIQSSRGLTQKPSKIIDWWVDISRQRWRRANEYADRLNPHDAAQNPPMFNQLVEDLEYEMENCDRQTANLRADIATRDVRLPGTGRGELPAL